MAEYDSLTGGAPQVIGHRGASAYRPEHTLEAYKLAIEMGAEVIEPDVVMTKDGHLIARHENLLDHTTDVSERDEFAHLYTTKVINGREVSGWFAEDFTLAEIKTLWARERIPDARPESATYDDQFRIPTIEEIVDLVNQVELETGRKIGIAPETKSPTHFAYTGTFIDGTLINADTSQMLVDALVAKGFTDGDRVTIQSFDMLNLIQLATEIMPAAGVDFKLSQLLGGAADIAFHFNPANADKGADPSLYDGFDFPLTAASATNADLYSAEAIQAMAKLYADILAPSKDAILRSTRLETPVDADGDGKAEITKILTGELLDLSDIAHAAGLEYVPWTVRADESYMALNPDGTVQLPVEEFVKLLDMGLDAIFTDFPDLGRAAVDQYMAGDGAIALSNGRGGNDILVRDASDFGAGKGSEGMDLAVYYGDGTVVLPGNVENLRLNGSSDAMVVGNALDNRILGNAGDNRFFESAGNDTINGGGGRDTLVLNGARDNYEIGVADGVANITNRGTGDVQRVADVESLLFTDGAQQLFATGQTEVMGIYRALLGRTAEEAGFDFWMGLSAEGMDMGTMTAAFAESAEHQARIAGKAEADLVNDLYTGALGRTADAEGHAYWVSELQAGTSLAEVAQGFVSSDEFQARSTLLANPDLWLNG
ncbi:type I secretion target GGXGXDXXX repeat-containing domain protein [Acetobacteraceae bacterium AT-5844]|nr:type I secretion target GGXGXDXXX repeat-containing domain protein [Acetobacteraceae bacterium AT-5844]